MVEATPHHHRELLIAVRSMDNKALINKAAMDSNHRMDNNHMVAISSRMGLLLQAMPIPSVLAR